MQSIMSIPGHSRLVEVWNPEQESFHPACLVDIDEDAGIGVLRFIGTHGCRTDTQNIPLNHLRPCQPSQTDSSAQYADREHVEVRFDHEGQGPSWRKGRVKGPRISNDPSSFLVVFDEVEYIAIYTAQRIRKAAGIPCISIKKTVVPLPRTLADFSQLDPERRFFCLHVDADAAGNHSATIIGLSEDVDLFCEKISQLDKVGNYIVAVHYADLAAPLTISSFESPPQTFTEAPSCLSRFFSEQSRWSAMKSAALAAVADPNCPRRALPAEPPLSSALFRPLPIVLRVRGPAALRVRLERSLSSQHVGTLKPGVAFAFSEVEGGWAKLSPMHAADLRHSSQHCDVSDYKQHNLETHGYCITAIDGRDVFDQPSDDQKAVTLERFRAFCASSAVGPVKQPVDHLEHWQGPRDGVDLSRFATEGVVKFNSHFSTVRGPSFNRNQGFCGYEIEVLSVGPVPQFGFCTSNFPRNQFPSGEGCGDDNNSWAWDGQRFAFWINGEAGRLDLPRFSWARGDVLTLRCDFSRNVTSIMIGGQMMHEHAFSPELDQLYPAITSRDDEIKVNFGARPFQYLRTSSIPAPSDAASASTRDPLPSTKWDWPSEQPPHNHYSDSGDCVNMAVYVKLAPPLFHNSDLMLSSCWARFLRCALYFSYATSAPQQCSKRALLLQATDRVSAWAAALASICSNDSRQLSESVGFDEDVQQLLGAEVLPSKLLIDMTAIDVADRVAAGPALAHYYTILKTSAMHGQAVLNCSAEELHELLLDVENDSLGKHVDKQHHHLILRHLLALKPGADGGSVTQHRPALQCDSLAQQHVKSSAELTFRALQSLFPEDARVLNLDLASLCDWPDFCACSWQDGEVAVPLSGVTCVGGVSFVYTEEFSRFFPSECFGSFKIAKVWVLPPYRNTASIGALLSQLSVESSIPSVTSSTRDNCALLVVLSGLTESCLDASIARKVLPDFGPVLPLPVIRKLLDFYQQLFPPDPDSQEGIQWHSAPQLLLDTLQTAGSSIDDSATSSLLIALKKFLHPAWSSTRLPIIKRVAKLLLACARTKPIEVFRSGLVDLILKMPVNSHTDMLLDAVRAVTSKVCVLPANPSNPCDILHSAAPNNWPDILNNFITDIHSVGHKTYEGMVCSFLCGRSHFARSCGALHQSIIDGLHSAISLHFREYYATSTVYSGCVLTCFVAWSKDSIHSVRTIQAGDYTSKDLVPLTRILIHLLFCGRFKHSYILPCITFLQSCIRLETSTIELESLYSALDAILDTIVPAVDPLNVQPLHVCLLPRLVYEVSTLFSGLELLQISANGVSVENVVSSLGWCELASVEEQTTDSVHLPLMHGALFDALKRCEGCSSTIVDLTAVTNLPFQTVKSCMQALYDMKFVRTRGSDAVFTLSDELPSAASLNAAALGFQQQQPGPSPLSVEHVEAYIEICDVLLRRVIRNSNAVSNPSLVSEAQLIADVSSSNSVPAAHVATAIYFLVARNIFKRISTGNNTFLVMSEGNADDDSKLLCISAAASGVTANPALPSLKFGQSSTFHKIVVFAISEDIYPTVHDNESLFRRCMLSLNTSSCVQFALKSCATDLLTSTINQLCACSDMSFLMAAKELMNSHGYPERVLIKCIDSTLYSRMFSDDVVSVPKVAGAAVFSDEMCNVCMCNDNLIQLPCKHCLCGVCFSARFLSDRSQHVYGALPDEQTPSASVNEDSPRRADFFSCPLCMLSLGAEFWSEFPSRMKQSQREMPEHEQVTLEQVHQKIVLNTLRVLRQDPLAALARYVPKKVSKSPGSPTSGHYIATVSVEQPVTCLDCAFDNISDIKNQETAQGSIDHQWRLLANKIRESGKGESSGSESADGSDIKPQFVSDAQRPQTEEGRLMDFRMCPVCFFGNIVNTTCSSMGTHHGEQNSINACTQCGFFSSSWSDWPKSDDRLKGQSFRTKLPFLNGICRAIAALDSALECVPHAPSRDVLACFSSLPSKQLVSSFLGRQFVRDELLHMRRLCMCAAIQNSNRAQNIGLKGLTAEEKHATLLLLLLKFKDSYVKPHIDKCCILGSGTKPEPVYIVHATLVCNCAIKAWTADSLDKFLIGDLGTSGTAPGNIKAMLDAAANKIMPSPIFRKMLDPDASAQNVLVEHAFQFNGMSAQDVALFKRMVLELRGSIFFEALSGKRCLDVVSVTHFLLCYLPFSRLMAIIASKNVVSVAMLLIHAVGVSSYSFLNPPSLSYRRTDPGTTVLAAADHLFRIRPLVASSTSHLTALLNQSRKIEVLNAASAPRPPPPAEQNRDSPVHISCDQHGNMYVCGTKLSCIRVLDASGSFLRDITITDSDGSNVPVKFLRASAVDWSSGNLYVTDRDADAVYCIAPSGQLITSLTPGVCNKPRGLSWCARSRRIAVADYDNHQVIILDSELNVILVLKGPTPTDKFQNPIDTDFDVNGFLYIVDSRNNRIVVMSDALTHLLSSGTKGKTDGCFDNPTAICVDGSGKVFVNSDSRTQVFDRACKHIVTFSSASLNAVVAWSDLYGIAVDHEGRLLICSQATNSVLRMM